MTQIITGYKLLFQMPVSLYESLHQTIAVPLFLINYNNNLHEICSLGFIFAHLFWFCDDAKEEEVLVV